MIDSPLAWHIPVWNQLYESAQHNTLPHALLLSSPSGTGKIQFGQAFAQLMLCEQPSTAQPAKQYRACGICQPCLWFQAQTHPNYYVIEPDRSNNVRKIVIEQIRMLIDALQKTAKNTTHHALHAYSSIIIIRSAETLHMAASNALLKTLEEPLPGILFLLITDQPQHLLTTIKSRCQRVTLPTPSFKAGIDWLSHHIQQKGQLTDSQSIEIALQLADYLPLKALQLLENKESLELYTLLWDSFIALRCDKQNPSEIAQKWATYPIELVFNYLHWSISDLIKLKLGVMTQHASIITISETVKALIHNTSLACLFSHLDAVQKTRYEMERYTLNTLLTLEQLATQLSSD